MSKSKESSRTLTSTFNQTHIRINLMPGDEKRTNEFFRFSILDNLLEGCQIIGFNWRYIYLNETAVLHNRKSKNETLNNIYTDLWPGIDKTEVYRLIKICLEDRIPSHLENEFIFPDGKIGWFDLSIQPVPEGVFILSIEITERKLAEKILMDSEIRYRSLFENMLNGFAYCRMIYQDGQPVDFIYLAVNKAFSYLTGLIGVTGKKVSEAIPGFKASDDTLLQTYARVASTGKHEAFEIFVKSLNDWYSISVYSPEKDYFIAVFDVITERKLAEEALRESEMNYRKLNETLELRVEERTKQLKAAYDELEAFSYSVSHDLRAPLRSINGFTQILVEDYAGKLDAEGIRFCSIIQENSQKMGTLIDDLLTFSRLGRSEMQIMTISMKRMVLSIFHELTDAASRERIEFNISDICDAHGDPRMLKQVWANLLSNAIKYSSKKERSVITVKCKKENDMCIYSVKDNGVGFDMHFKDKLFGVFQRLHSTLEFDGTGVGLAIVQRIINRHKGEVWATGAIDEGAEFNFSLPLNPDTISPVI